MTNLKVSSCSSTKATRGNVFQIGVIEASKGSVQKRILNVDGRPAKDKNHNLSISQGKARVVEFAHKPLVGLANLIRRLKPNEALTLGVPPHRDVNYVFPKGQLESLSKVGRLNLKRAISRSKDHYSWPTSNHAVLFDHDPEPGQPELDAEQFWSALCACVPELTGVGRVVTVSTSSSIYDKSTGDCLKPADGHHTYIVVRGDVEKLKRILHTLTWLNGFGFHKFSTPNEQTGVPSILERTLLDLTVFSPERLVYEAGAIVPPEFEQRRPDPRVIDGPVLDIDALPEPTPEELATVERLVKESRAKFEAERAEVVAKTVQKQQPGITPEKAKRIAKKRIKAVDSGTLAPDHVLYLSNGQVITAGEIGPEHHKQTLCDPQEPTYRGGRSDVAMIHCDRKGRWTITSWAHGFHKYRPALFQLETKPEAFVDKLVKQVAKPVERPQTEHPVEEVQEETPNNWSPSLQELCELAGKWVKLLDLSPKQGPQPKDKAVHGYLKAVQRYQALEQKRLESAVIDAGLSRCASDQSPEQFPADNRYHATIYYSSLANEAKTIISRYHQLAIRAGKGFSWVEGDLEYGPYQFAGKGIEAYTEALDFISERKKENATHKELYGSAGKWNRLAAPNGEDIGIVCGPEANSSDSCDAYEQRIKQCKDYVLKQIKQPVTYDRDIINTGGAFPADVLNSLLHGERPVVVSGVTGGGKTELATQLAKQLALSSQAPTKTYGISPTQVLSIEMAGRFSGKGVSMASSADASGNFQPYKNSAVPAESIWKLKNALIHFLAADEPDAWIERILSGMLGDAADLNLAQLQRMAREIIYQYWLNADINPLTVELLEQLAGVRPEVVNLIRHQATKPIAVFEYEDFEGFPAISGAWHLYQHFYDAAAQGKRVLLLGGSVDKCRALRTALRKLGVKAELRDGRYCPKERRLGFAKNPDALTRQANVVILSRLAETGIDLQSDFDAVYCCVSPQMSARATYQFISRSRSLLRGDTPELHIYLPAKNRVGLDEMDPVAVSDEIRSTNKTYLKLIKRDTADIAKKLEAVNWAIDWSGRFKAAEARNTYFRNELLTAKWDELGWPVDHKPYPMTYGEHGPEPVEMSIKEVVEEELLEQPKTRSKCIARGKREIHEYPHEYQTKLADNAESGWILDCKRRKLELASLLPDSELEDWQVVHQLETDRDLLPQALLRGAMGLTPGDDKSELLADYIQSGHVDTARIYGPMEGLKGMKRSKTLISWAIADLCAGSPFLKRVLAGDDRIDISQDDTKEFAALLNRYEDVLNLWCSKFLGRKFSWTEDALSVVCKFLDKMLGIKSAPIGQERLEVDGKIKKCRVMHTILSEPGQRAIAKRESKKDDGESLQSITRRLELLEKHSQSALTGWRNKIKNLESSVTELVSGPGTLNSRSKKESLEFSVPTNGPPFPLGRIGRLIAQISECQDGFDLRVLDFNYTKPERQEAWDWILANAPHEAKRVTSLLAVSA